MGTFSIDVKLYATAYVTAETEEEARAILSRVFGSEQEPTGCELAARDIEIEDGVVISPAVTFYGSEPGQNIEQVA